MSVTVMKVGDSLAVFFGRKLIKSYDHKTKHFTTLEKETAHSSINDIAYGLSTAVGSPLGRVTANENPDAYWTWEELADKYIREPEAVISLTVSAFNEEAYSHESKSLQLSQTGIVDIIDHASQLIAIARSIALNKCSADDFNTTLGELESALLARDVIEEVDELLPTFVVDNKPAI